MKTMFNMMKVLHIMMKVGKIKMKIFPTHRWLKTWVYKGIVNSKKSQTIWLLHKNNCTNLLGKWGRFEKEIVKLITLERNK
jgi:hypothetical protein